MSPFKRSYFKKQLWLCLFVITGIAIAVSFKQKEVKEQPTHYCRQLVLSNIDTIIYSLNASLNINAFPSTQKKSQSELINYYRLARKNYKEIEFFIEYYSAFDAKYYINGPLITKYEIEWAPKVFEPQGFQVIEEYLYNSKAFNAEKLTVQYQLLIRKFEALKDYYTNITVELPNLNEALQLQMIRIMCLTLNGYDCTINKETLTECASAFNGISKLVASYEPLLNDRKKIKQAQKSLKKCREWLLKNTDSDNFDRLYFITRVLNPAYKNLSAFFNNLNLPASPINYAVDLKAISIFNISTINKQHFSIYRNDTLNNTAQAQLGKLLFFDPLISGNNKRACASCHKPELAFTDGLDKSIGYDGITKIQRNAPTLLNASFQKLFFYDGRALNLEQQADGVFHNGLEMKISKQDVINKLRQSNEYRQLFKAAFFNSPDTAITFYAALKSIAEYIKTLESKNSKFDAYLSGNYNALTREEINGFNLFNGKALCGSCHFFPVFNGTVPPMFNDSEFEVIGTALDSTNLLIDTDAGRETITHNTIHQHAFKTPTLRNIALTAPYMHNGAYYTLDQVLNFYNKGGGAGLKFKVENQTLPFDSLGLTKTELNNIKLFLLTLTDTTHLANAPKKLPLINNPVLNERKPGGDY